MHLQLVFGQPLDPQRRGLSPFFSLQALMRHFDLAGLGLGPFELHIQPARLVLHMHQIQGGQHDGQREQEVGAHQATSVRWAMRMTALRARALAATSAVLGMRRARPSSFMGCGVAMGARRS